MKLIDKAALVAEIERRKLYHIDLIEYNSGYKNAIFDILSIIDTLEVKGVDLQSEIDRVWDNTSDNFSEDGWKEFEDIAKHFFELGIKAAQKGE
jgi:hypothetical protein